MPESGLWRGQSSRRTHLSALQHSPAHRARHRSPQPLSPRQAPQDGRPGAVYKATDTKANNREVAIKDMIGSDPQEFAIRLNFFRREAEILRSLGSGLDRAALFDFVQRWPVRSPGDGIHPRQGHARFDGSQREQAFSHSQCYRMGQEHVRRARHHAQAESAADSPRPQARQHHALRGPALDQDDRLWHGPRPRPHLERSGWPAKTRVYTEGLRCPPEQIVGKPEPRSDLFALAATLYHLADWQKPPEGFYTAKELETAAGRPPVAAASRSTNGFSSCSRSICRKTSTTAISRPARSSRIWNASASARRFNVLSATRTTPCASRICIKSATPLTDADQALCGSCGKNNRLGSRFCVHCGNRLAVMECSVGNDLRCRSAND